MNTPSEIARIYVDVGSGKVKIPAGKMLVMGIFAGMFIAFGALGSTIASCGVQPAALGRFLSALVFPIGLMLVLCAGAELFTGNSLLLIPLMERRIKFFSLIKNWVIVYIGNLIGSVLLAYAVSYSHSLSLYDGELVNSTISIATAKLNLTFTDGLVKGILCNIMVCLAVWVAFAAKDLGSKILALFLPVFLFVLCGFEHCVANMYFIPAGIFASEFYGVPAQLDWISFAVNNLAPVTLGNIIGGAIFVGFGYWVVYLKDNT